MTQHRYTTAEIHDAARNVGLDENMADELTFQVEQNTLTPTADEQAKIDAFGIDHPEEDGPGEAALAQAARAPFVFTRRPDEELGLQTIVYEALGGASSCWEAPERAGVFDSTRAKEIGDLAMVEIQKKLAQTWQEGVNYGRHHYSRSHEDDAANPHRPL